MEEWKSGSCLLSTHSLFFSDSLPILLQAQTPLVSFHWGLGGADPLPMKSNKKRTSCPQSPLVSS